jgi:PEP-CTERM motif
MEVPMLMPALIRSVACMTVVLGIVGARPVLAAADTIEVKNNRQSDVILSDLIVYGKKPGERTELVKPKNASDDVPFKPGDRKTFESTFPIARYMISELFLGSEMETIMFDVKLEKPRKFGMLLDPTLAPTVFLAIDDDLYSDPPPPGTVLAFNNGINPLRPDWFVGTSIDFDMGVVSGGYTGDAIVAATDFDVTVSVAEPATLLLVGVGVAAATAVRMRRRFSFRRGSRALSS